MQCFFLQFLIILGDGNQTCDDINECDLELNDCAMQAMCNNRYGHFT